jgi:hypothetical protein
MHNENRNEESQDGPTRKKARTEKDNSPLTRKGMNKYKYGSKDHQPS